MSQATYYFRFYLARALQHAGMGQEYLSLLQPWRDMMALGLTTWAEQPEPTRSDSHAWSAHPNYDLLTIVAGIQPGSTGFRTVTIAPNLGVLKHVSATMAHPGGEINVEYSTKSGTVNATVSLPPGTSGTLIWQRHDYPLDEGSQTFGLPPRAVQ
jgi:alpha-L-rhamnosidase